MVPCPSFNVDCYHLDRHVNRIYEERILYTAVTRTNHSTVNVREQSYQIDTSHFFIPALEREGQRSNQLLQHSDSLRSFGGRCLEDGDFLLDARFFLR